MSKSTKVFFVYILIFAFIVSIILTLKKYHDNNNLLSNTGIKTRGIVYKRRLNSEPVVSFNSYLEIYYKFSTPSTYYNIHNGKREPLEIYGIKKEYNILTNHYFEGDTIFVLYSKDNPEISDISYKSLDKPEEMNYLTVLFFLPQIGIIDILILISSLIITGFLIRGILWLYLRNYIRNTQNIINISIKPADSTYAIIIGCFFLLVAIIPNVLADIDIFQNPLSILNHSNGGVNFFINITGIILRLTLSFWAYNFSGKLNRNKILWALLTLIYPPISLIILGILGESIGHEALKDIINKSRLDYLEESRIILDGISLSDKQYKIKLNELRKKHDQLLNSKLNNFLAKEKAVDNKKSKKNRKPFLE